MVVEQILLKNFRHFQHVLFNFHQKANLIVGCNGSGKTSLLESIYFLSYSKSFRSSSNRNIIGYDQNHLQIDAKIHHNQEVLTIHNIHSNQRENNQVRLNQDHKIKQTEIAKMLPVVFIDTSTHREFAHTPKNRRDFLNWCCFYIDTDYHRNLSQYQKALEQRNHLLKQQKQQSSSLLATWTEPLIFYAEKIHTSRVKMLALLNEQITQIWPYFFAEPCAILNYQCGWKKDLDYADCLKQSIEQDVLYGHTQYGPHRADLICQTHLNHLIFQSFSQGQQKLFSYIMKFIQLHMVTSLKQQQGILLIDDLPAELDACNQAKIIEFINTIDCQKFLTALDGKLFQPRYTNHAIFVDKMPLPPDSHRPAEVSCSPIA